LRVVVWGNAARVAIWRGGGLRSWRRLGGAAYALKHRPKPTFFVIEEECRDVLVVDECHRPDALGVQDPSRVLNGRRSNLAVVRDLDEPSVVGSGGDLDFEPTEVLVVHLQGAGV